MANKSADTAGLFSKTANNQYNPPNIELEALLDTRGVYVGEGFPPVPAKLAAKIRQGDFIRMGELLSKFWSMPKDDDCHQLKAEPSRC